MSVINLIYDAITSPDTDKEFCVNSKITFGNELTIQLPMIDVYIKDDNYFNDFYQVPSDYSKSGGIDPSNFINKMKNNPAVANVPFGRYMLCAAYHFNEFIVLVEEDYVHICNVTLKRTFRIDNQLISFFSMIRDKMNKMRNVHGLNKLEIFENSERMKNDVTTKLDYMKAFNKLYYSGYASPEFKNRYNSIRDM